MSSYTSKLNTGVDTLNLSKLSDQELLDLVWSYEGYYQCNDFEPEIYKAWWADACKLNEEALRRGLGCHFELFQEEDDDDLPDWFEEM